MPRLFGTAGIRGPYMRALSPELAFKVGLALATHVGGKGSACVGYDTRTTSPLLALSVSAGLMAGGLDVNMLGLVPTPVLAYSIPHTRSSCGVIVTASHNPPTDNGLKCFSSEGMEYTTSMELELEDVILGGGFKYAEWDHVGRLIEAHEVLEHYVEDLYERFAVREGEAVKVVVDCANGSASHVTPRLLRMLGAKVVSINSHPDGFFPGRHPEPRPDVLSYLGHVVKALGAAAGLAHDGDADRLAVIAEDGSFIYNDRVIAFFAKLKLQDKKGTVITSIDTSFVVDEVVERYGGKVVRTRLGKTHEKLKEVGDVVLAAEPWKIIDPSWGPWVDGVYQAVAITSMLVKTGLTISKLFEDIPSYPQERFSIPVPEDRKHDIIARVHERMREEFKGYVSEWDFDGLRLNLDDGSWVLARASGTEPKIRGYCEARSLKRLKEISGKLRRIMMEEVDKAVKERCAR